MPLVQGYSDNAIRENIRREMKAGRTRKQAVAIAMSTARVAAKAAGKPEKAPKRPPKD